MDGTLACATGRGKIASYIARFSPRRAGKGNASIDFGVGSLPNLDDQVIEDSAFGDKELMRNFGGDVDKIAGADCA